MASLLTMSNKRGKLMNVLHVSIITKNLVSNRQIVHRGMQVWFKHLRCFIEEKGKVIVQGHREGGMFVLKCLRKGKRSSRISTYGTSGSTMSTSHSFEKRRQRISFSVCRNLVAEMAKSAKPANSGSGTDFHSPMIEIGAGINSI